MLTQKNPTRLVYGTFLLKSPDTKQMGIDTQKNISTLKGIHKSFAPFYEEEGHALQEYSFTVFLNPKTKKANNVIFSTNRAFGEVTESIRNIKGIDKLFERESIHIHNHPSVLHSLAELGKKADQNKINEWNFQRFLITITPSDADTNSHIKSKGRTRNILLIPHVGSIDWQNGEIYYDNKDAREFLGREPYKSEIAKHLEITKARFSKGRELALRWSQGRTGEDKLDEAIRNIEYIYTKHKNDSNLPTSVSSAFDAVFSFHGEREYLSFLDKKKKLTPRQKQSWSESIKESSKLKNEIIKHSEEINKMFPKLLDNPPYHYTAFTISGAVAGTGKFFLEKVAQSAKMEAPRIISYPVVLIGSFFVSEWFKDQQREIIAGSIAGVIGEEIVKWYRNKA